MTKIFGKAITPSDRLPLQLDLDALCKWAEDWQMKFNVSKCKVIHTGPGNTNGSYFMNGQLLNSVTEHKDIGVIISSNLKVADHCHYACNKANKMLGIFKRTIKHRNITVMVQLYKSLVSWSTACQYGVRITAKTRLCLRVSTALHKALFFSL